MILHDLHSCWATGLSSRLCTPAHLPHHTRTCRPRTDAPARLPLCRAKVLCPVREHVLVREHMLYIAAIPVRVVFAAMPDAAAVNFFANALNLYISLHNINIKSNNQHPELSTLTCTEC